MATTTASVADRPNAGSASPGLTVSLRKRAIAVGVFFLITEVAAIAGNLLRTSVSSDPAYVLGAGSDLSIFLGSFFELVLVVAVIGTAVALYPLIKKQNEKRRPRLRLRALP